jgi:hypothetical protein
VVGGIPTFSGITDESGACSGRNEGLGCLALGCVSIFSGIIGEGGVCSGISVGSGPGLFSVLGMSEDG